MERLAHLHQHSALRLAVLEVRRRLLDQHAVDELGAPLLRLPGPIIQRVAG